MFRALLDGLVRQLPSQCAVCHAWPSRNVCDDCVASHAQPMPRCRSCARVVPAGVDRCGECTVQPPALDATVAAVSYAYPWSRLIAEFKFREQTGWARRFASLMRSTPWAEPLLDAADWIIPMPLSRQRLHARGFNQSLLLARALDGNRRLRHDLLLRVQDTPPQSSLPRAQRLHNLRHAFLVEPLHCGILQGRRVLLVDDVMTSGASLQACALALRRAGAGSVDALVLARTE